VQLVVKILKRAGTPREVRYVLKHDALVYSKRLAQDEMPRISLLLPARRNTSTNTNNICSSSCRSSHHTSHASSEETFLFCVKADVPIVKASVVSIADYISVGIRRIYRVNDVGLNSTFICSIFARQYIYAFSRCVSGIFFPRNKPVVA